MKHKTFLVAAASLLFGALAPAHATHYEIFLLAGQSNMDGRAAASGLTGDLASYQTPRPDVLIHLSAGGLHRPLTLSDGFKPLQPGYSADPHAKPLTLPSGTFGPEVSFGAAMAGALPGKQLLLVKCAEGGTNLCSDWNPNERGKLYDRFLDWVRQTQKMIAAKGDTYEIRGMVWHQGEADAAPDKAAQYQERLTELVGRVRSDLGLNGLPFVIGQVYDNGKRGTVIAAQKAVAKEVPHTAFAEADGLSTFDAGTHFDTPSQIELGKRCAREMKKLLGLPATAPAPAK